MLHPGPRKPEGFHGGNDISSPGDIAQGGKVTRGVFTKACAEKCEICLVQRPRVAIPDIDHLLFVTRSTVVFWHNMLGSIKFTDNGDWRKSLMPAGLFSR